MFRSKEPVFVTVKGKDKHDEPMDMELPILLPHQILEHLISKCQLEIPDSLVNQYWQKLETSGDELALKSKTYRELAGPVWPVGLHGDEASMSIQNAPFDKIWGVFLSVILFRPKETRTSRFLLFSVASNRVLDVRSTMYPLLEKVTESLNLAAENGVLGRRCLVSELRGDQVWFKYIFQHQSFWLKTEMCPRCAATSQSGPTCYLHYDAHLPLKTTDEFIREELPNDDKL